MDEHVFPPGTRERTVEGETMAIHAGSGVTARCLERAVRLYESMAVRCDKQDRKTAREVEANGKAA